MLAVTNLDTVLDTIFKEKEFQLYCKIDRADVGEKVALMDFFKELRSAKGKLIRKYKASDKWEKLRCDLQMGNLHVVLVKEVCFWRKLIERRMRRTPRFCSPYRIDITLRISEDIFCSVKDLLTCVTKYGLDLHLTKSQIEIKIWSKRRLELFFKNLIDQNLPKKEIKNCNVEHIVPKDKMFILKYRKTTETLNIICFYGVWNEYLVPQHI